MSVYIYRRRASTGARNLANALGGIRSRQAPQLKPNDYLVCWGSDAGFGANPRVLNDVPLRNKYEDTLELKRKGVSTIEVCLRRPIAEAERPLVVPIVAPEEGIEGLFQIALEHANEFIENEHPNFGSPVFIRGVKDFKNALVRFSDALGGVHAPKANVAPARPPAPPIEWLGRRYDHVGGKDLLRPGNPDYFAKKEQFVEEFRVHSFLGKSLRAGKKVHRDDFRGQIHPWIRSWDGGWRIEYKGVEGNPDLRNLAHKAVAALGLNFGAVDIGKRPDGTLVVLEVNRAPGIEGGTVDKYKDAIEQWMGVR